MYPTVKRFLDICISAVSLVVFSPLLLLTALLVRLTSPGPAVFTQKRAGRNGKIFTIYKFRTMRRDTPSNLATHLLSNPESFITPIGRLLRKTSLDELPQLFNVLRGDMSLIGPRPALFNQYDLIRLREEAGVNRVRPGLTGWAQVNGRDLLSIPEKVAYDREYVENLSLRFDLKCLLRSFTSVLSADGVKEGGTGRRP
ncbi:MAG TPA: sugar transferase [Candidatus Pullichristensenella excrementigallinarum]|uniref:Sugar transferase n=1 Tax=Candidatus Pullichristensenella excrementigallinarum TaxID=2840907 RepID=A0A9D1IE12_9FIRM|nr:sugar transferase [Candidatus Pullichristensenella excrementigallinarum]